MIKDLPERDILPTVAPEVIDECSEHSAGCHALDGTDAEKVSETGGSQQGCVAHTPEESRVGQFGSDVGMFDGGFAHSDGEHIADDHHQSHLGRPGEGRGSHREEVRQHSDSGATPHHRISGQEWRMLLRVVHFFTTRSEQADHQNGIRQGEKCFR